jgi:hypothetical protein
MNLRMITILLVASATASLASAGEVSNTNPKTAQLPYAQAASNASQAEAVGAADAKLDKGGMLALKQAAIRAGKSGGSAQPLQPGNPSLLAPAGSDNCATPTPIVGVGTFAFDNSAATTGTQGQTEALCLAYGVTGIDNDIWFSWNAPSSGTATMSLCSGTGMDSKIAAYPGLGCPGAGSALACNDDTCALQSAISFLVVGGSNYILQLGNYPTATGAAGTFDLFITTGGPANDDCSNAIAISGAGPFPFNTTGATTSAQQSGSCPIAGHDIWYNWTAGASGVGTISLCGSTFDTVVAVYSAGGCPLSGTGNCDDDFCGLQSQATFPCVAGNQYAVQIGGYGANSGPGTFTIAVSPSPPNDSCSSPTAISGQGSTSFDNTAATTGTEGQNEALCLAFGTTGIVEDLWYAWTPTLSGPATMTLCGLTTNDSKIAAYAGAGCPAPGSALACNDDTCGTESEITFTVSAGSTYMLQVGCYPGTGGGPGQFTLSVVNNGFSYLCDPGTSPTIACPCANPPSGTGRGCNNSSSTGGASISGSGNPSVAASTVVFTTASEKPTALSILMQGTTVSTSGIVFGQGIRCVTGSLKRLYTHSAVGGSITAPSGTDLDIPTRSANLGDPILPGQNRWYMVYYRDSTVLGGCSSFSTFNDTNTAQVAWQ